MPLKTRNIFVWGLLLVSLPLFSQQNKDTAKSAAISKHKILLVPFKGTMFMDEIGKAVMNPHCWGNTRDFSQVSVSTFWFL